MLTAQEARRLDLNSEELGVPVSQLMANAGARLAEAVWKEVPKGGGVLLFCGKGNNGGDGLAAAVALHDLGRKPWVVLAEPKEAMAGPGREFLSKLKKRNVAVWSGKPEAGWEKVPVLVDCLLGTGAQGKPRAPYDSIIRYLNGRAAAGAEVISCDVPSGLGSSLAVKPSRTVTFHSRKAGMARANSGVIHAVNIGIPEEAETTIGFGDLATAYSKPDHNSHKGQNGVILLVAGSVPLTGAPRYVAMGAYRAGADLVHAVMPAEAAAVARTFGPESIVHDGCPGRTLTLEAVQVAAKLMAKCTALVIGPGLGSSKPTLEAVRAILQAAAKRKLPIVVDADGLDALDAAFLRKNGSRMVLTPHAREFKDLAGREGTAENVAAYAKAHKVTVLRKSATDVVSDGARTRSCSRGHPTMTVGGTGDVLAGIVATLMAKGAPPFEAACASSYLWKCAGEVAASHLSYGATASDIADAIPAVLLRLDQA